MNKLLIILTLSILITGCINDSKDTKSVGLSDQKEVISQRHLHEKTFGDYSFKNEQKWDSLNTIYQKKVRYKKGKVHPDFRTFGWHIYSNGSAWKNYNFSMLWGLSYFSYTIQPETGSYKNIHQWKTTALIDSAKAYDCKVFLSVSNFGSANNSMFLENSKAQRTLIDSLSSLLAFKDADGINIDFEGVPQKNKADFTHFILEVSKKLKQDNPKYMISLCLYATDWNDIFEIEAIDPYIDFYTLMGYDYYGGFSKTTGPVSPLKNTMTFGNGLEESVTVYKNKGVQLDKLIIGLPYYGVEWYTTRPEIGATVTKFKSHPAYNSIREIDIYSLRIPLRFDPKSASSYIIIKDSANHYRQLFFEDVKSLSIKYDWIKKNKIGGVGIWALGYDNGYPELWNLLTEKFSQSEDSTVHNIK
jgi:spore germination protein YaaH